jgi:hypothetical protein
VGDVTRPERPATEPGFDNPTDDPSDLFTSVRRRMLRGSAWVMAGKVVTIVLGLAISALLARLLTREEVGAYFTTYSLVVIGSTFAQFGLDRAVVRFVSVPSERATPDSRVRRSERCSRTAPSAP